MNDVSRVSKLPVVGEEFAALSVCPSSKLQLLQWVPTQWLWNGKRPLVFALSWRPWMHASPQKQASAITLFVKIPRARSRTINTLNVLRFPNIFFSPYLVTLELRIQYIFLRSIECNILMVIFTIWQWKYPNTLPNGMTDQKKVLIQIRSVHRKFLRVTKSYDCRGLESWQFGIHQMLWCTVSILVLYNS